MKVNNNVDILMATYQGEQFIENQIESILQQTHTQWKLYIRDDGSSDKTVDIVKSYILQYPEKFVLIEDGRSGLGAKDNFLELLKYSSADYVMFCDQDDYWLNNKIKITLSRMKQIEQKNQGLPLLVHTDLKVVDENLNLVYPSFCKYQNITPEITKFNRLVVQNNITGCTMMINSKLRDLITHKVFKDSIMHDWIIGIVASLFGKISFVHEQTILYRQHTKNDVGAKKVNFNYYINKLRTFNKVRTELIKTQKQSGDILKNFQLPSEIKVKLGYYQHLQGKSWIYKRFWIIRHCFLKHNVLRIIGELIVI